MKELNSTSPVSLIILIIVIIFAANISYETYDDMDQKFTITDTQSRNCLVDFQDKNCNPLKLTDDCQIIFECIQKENGEDFLNKSESFLDFIISEIHENLMVPTVMIIILLIYQLTKNVENLRRND